LKSVPLTAVALPAIRSAVRARRILTLEVKGGAVARVERIVTVTKKQAAQILHQIAQDDRGDDWAAGQT
jgi:hypothetical protein